MSLAVAYIHDTKKIPKKSQLFSEFYTANEILSATELRNLQALIFEKDQALQFLLSKIGHAKPEVWEALSSLDIIALFKLKHSINYTVHHIFRKVVIIDPETDLTIDEISEVFRSDHPEHYIIGGHVDHENRLITLYRGDLKPILRSFDSFTPNATSKPNFKKFKVVDGGLSIALGNYEASTYPILYESDSNFRREINKQRKEEDRSFGSCLYRARMIKGLKQSELGLPRETIHRIENSKTDKVQERTKRRILKALGLSEFELLN